MADVYTITFAGRLTKDPEVKRYGNKGDSLTSLSVASTIGFGDNANTVFTNCTAFGKTGEFIAKYMTKGDGVFITGIPRQNKVDGKTYNSVIVQGITFGAKKNKDSKPDKENNNSDGNPFDDSDIPF